MSIEEIIKVIKEYVPMSTLVSNKLHSMIENYANERAKGALEYVATKAINNDSSLIGKSYEQIYNEYLQSLT